MAHNAGKKKFLVLEGHLSGAQLIRWSAWIAEAAQWVAERLSVQSSVELHGFGSAMIVHLCLAPWAWQKYGAPSVDGLHVGCLIQLCRFWGGRSITERLNSVGPFQDAEHLNIRTAWLAL